jgi:hypothetical protein
MAPLGKNDGQGRIVLLLSLQDEEPSNLSPGVAFAESQHEVAGPIISGQPSFTAALGNVVLKLDALARMVSQSTKVVQKAVQR